MPDLALDLRYLSHAILIAECGSFRRAAAALDLSQSTISRRVQLLERRLGVPLFERSRRGARLTAAGERFIRDAAVGAEYLRDAVNELSRIKQGGVGVLRIGLTSSHARGALAELLKAYHRLFPDVEVRLQEGTSQANASAVMHGLLDAAFIVGKPLVTGCEVKHFCDETLVVAVPSDHCLAGCPSVTWQDLSEQRFLVSSDGLGPEIANVVIRRLSSVGFQPAISQQHVGVDNLLNMVGHGFGITLAAKSSLSSAHTNVQFIPIGPRHETVSWSAAWSPTNKNPALRRLLQLSSNSANNACSAL